ncbi:MAG TPA: transcription antitermination factor NusB [Defluviitoga sp.]|nr:transcription antitermination factor NusB [Defluviitoga sp.]HOP24387.1 transcription antitermination factor NusB [Defluviitoga sp.]HPZ28623.1 transcription antitermination factor NusB [Defluviitoga sp.]HQD62586.1 transcription antitermination factor NusB [Defluviitoga sp.]
MNDSVFQKRLMRKIVFESLFQMDINDSTLDEILFTLEKLNEQVNLGKEYYEEAKKYVTEIYNKKSFYDSLIDKYSKGWPVERIGNVEKTAMRICVYELLNKKDIPVKVILNEAVELTKTYSSQKSASFVNGVINKIARSQALLT